jgi:hypothetical protein
MRRLVAHPLPLILVLVVAAVLAACSSDDSGSKKKSSSTTTGAAGATTAPSTAQNDPAACMRGNFRFTRMDYDGPVQTAFGPTTIAGGIAGRRIELRPDNTFRFTDDGREPVQFSVPSQGGTVTGTGVLNAQANGSYAPTASSSSFNITALSGTLALTFYDGSTTNIPLPPDGAGVKETFGLNGEATYTCEGNRVSFRFPTLTIALERV